MKKDLVKKELSLASEFIGQYDIFQIGTFVFSLHEFAKFQAKTTSYDVVVFGFRAETYRSFSCAKKSQQSEFFEPFFVKVKSYISKINWK